MSMDFSASSSISFAELELGSYVVRALLGGLANQRGIEPNLVYQVIAFHDEESNNRHTLYRLDNDYVTTPLSWADEKHRFHVLTREAIQYVSRGIFNRDLYLSNYPIKSMGTEIIPPSYPLKELALGTVVKSTNIERDHYNTAYIVINVSDGGENNPDVEKGIMNLRTFKVIRNPASGRRFRIVGGSLEIGE